MIRAPDDLWERMEVWLGSKVSDKRKSRPDDHLTALTRRWLSYGSEWLGEDQREITSARWQLGEGEGEPKTGG